MIRERELRLALICYGGVSLAVYMHGVTKELWKLLRASEARRRGAVATGDTEGVWHDLLEALGATAEVSVVCDILAGASAGGLNAVLLSNALTMGHDLEPLTDMWLEEADVEKLLDPEARPTGTASRLARFYKEPVAWLAARQSDSLATVDDPDVRAEIAVKLAGFVRSRWFKPPFSGDVLTAMLDRAMDAMEAQSTGVSLLPPGHMLDLHVTVTDYWGSNTVLAIHSPSAVTEREHRRMFAFHSPPVLAGEVRAPAGERPALLFAARSTASFPGAFPPAHIGEIDRRLAERGREWPERAAFVQAHLPGERAAEDVLLIDGSVLNNAPFGAAIAAVRRRVAHREVDRRFVYIDPKPGIAGPLDSLDDREPGFFTAMFRAMADIPRTQPIRDSLDTINRLSARVRRIRQVIDAMTPAVDEAILKSVGLRFFLLPVGQERLERARSRIQSVAAKEAGFAFAGYAQMKLHGVLDEAARLLAQAAGLTVGEAALLRTELAGVAERRGAFDQDGALSRDPPASGYVKLLRHLDIGFRVRRLRFFIRRVTQAIAEATTSEERAAAEALKARMYRVVAPFESLRAASFAGEAGAAASAKAALSASEPRVRHTAAAAALDGLGAALNLSALDAEADAMLAAAVADPAFSRPVRQALVRAWLGFPFYDIAILPMMQEETADSFDELKVDRISPDDAVALCEGGARACLKGWQLNAFAAFFSRAYRENDYLFGRLHAAERLVDIVASVVPEAVINGRQWKSRLFSAILAAERARLGRIGPLFEELEGRLAAWNRA